MELLKKLCETPGSSGCEERVQKVIVKELEKITDEVKLDKLGSVIGIKRANRILGEAVPKKVMVAAHMDEIGFMINYIDNDGFLRFTPTGNFDPVALITQRVIVHGRKDIRGIVYFRPPHILIEEGIEKKVPKLKELFIDVGLSKDEVSKIVKLGNSVTLDRDFKELNDKIVIAKAFDDRVGVYIMIEVLKRIKDCYVDIYAVATVQEEVGFHRGATISSFSIEPDIGVVLDVSYALDIPNIKKEEILLTLGGGAAITLVEHGTIPNKKIVDFLRGIAFENDIKYQEVVSMGGGSDGMAIQRTKSGVPTVVISIPNRYMHTTVEMCHKDDIENTIRLVTKFLENAHRKNF